MTNIRSHFSLKSILLSRRNQLRSGFSRATQPQLKEQWIRLRSTNMNDNSKLVALAVQELDSCFRHFEQTEHVVREEAKSLFPVDGMSRGERNGEHTKRSRWVKNTYISKLHEEVLEAEKKFHLSKRRYDSAQAKFLEIRKVKENAINAFAHSHQASFSAPPGEPLPLPETQPYAPSQYPLDCKSPEPSITQCAPTPVDVQNTAMEDEQRRIPQDSGPIIGGSGTGDWPTDDDEWLKDFWELPDTIVGDRTLMEGWDGERYPLSW